MNIQYRVFGEKFDTTAFIPINNNLYLDYFSEICVINFYCIILGNVIDSYQKKKLISNRFKLWRTLRSVWFSCGLACIQCNKNNLKMFERFFKNQLNKHGTYFQTRRSLIVFRQTFDKFSAFYGYKDTK